YAPFKKIFFDTLLLDPVLDKENSIDGLKSWQAIVAGTKYQAYIAHKIATIHEHARHEAAQQQAQLQRQAAERATQLQLRRDKKDVYWNSQIGFLRRLVKEKNFPAIIELWQDNFEGDARN